MINVSDQFKKEIEKNTNVKLQATIEFPLLDTSISVSGGRFWSGSIQFEDAISSNGSFDIGAAIINQFSAKLNNQDGYFSNYDLDGAVIYPQVGKELSDGTVEWISKGAYTIDNPVMAARSISITALDNLHRFEKEYSKVNTVYPATIGQIVRDMATYCGVPMVSGTFDNEDYIVSSRPDDDSLTCLAMLLYAAQIAGCYARCNNQGFLEMKWYTEADKDSADHNISKFSSINVSQNDIVITGIKVTDSGSGSDATEYLYGSDDYALSISSNPLIETGKAQEVAEYLGKKIVGIKFRKIDCSCLANPTVEAGDSACVTDRYGNKYFCYLNNVTYSIGSYMKIACEAKTPSSNRATPVSNETKSIINARKEAQKVISSYDKTVQSLTSLITQSFGAYKTEERQADGSVIYYMHDKPTLAESKNIWRMAANVFAVSDDGGKTWKAGIDSSGNAVMNVVNVVGLNASYINTGTLVARDADGNVILSVNVDTGEVSISAEAIKMAAGSLKDYADANDKKVAEIAAEAGQVSVVAKDEQGELSSVINTKEWETKYTDANGNVLSAIKFDPLKKRFVISGRLSISDNFTVSEGGNIYAKGLAAPNLITADITILSSESNNTATFKEGYLEVSGSGNSLVGIGLGEYNEPVINFNNQASQIAYKNGIWIGSGATVGSDLEFTPNEKCNGVFIDTAKNTVYIVSGYDEKEVYTGTAIARFG